MCECGIAVANALPTLIECADLVTQYENGEGVEEIIQQLIKDDLASLDSRLQRRAVPLGTRVDDGAKSN